MASNYWSKVKSEFETGPKSVWRGVGYPCGEVWGQLYHLLHEQGQLT